MNGNGKQRAETEATGGGDDGSLLDSFALVRAVLQAAARCLVDEDRTPYVVVVDRTEISYAQRVWAAIGSSDEVAMEPVPDT